MGGCNSAGQAPRQKMLNQAGKKEPCPKVVLLGETYVGKSSIVRRYQHEVFNNAHDVTVGGAFQQFSMTTRDGTRMKMNLWDTGGEERFRSMLKMYYKDADAALIVYDVSKPQTFLSVEYWLEQLNEQIQTENMVIYLVGNKIDLAPEQIKVTWEQAHDKYIRNSNINIHLAQTSASKGQGVKELFQDLTENLYRNHLDKTT